jgi:hypothetical protein
MQARDRKKVAMGRSVGEFSAAHPHDDPGYNAVVARIMERIMRADQLAAQQRKGILEVRTATVRKRALRRELKNSQLAHVLGVGRVAAREVPALAQQIVMKPGSSSYDSFRTAARGLESEALARKELLVKHGLVTAVLESLTRSLDEFDAEMERSTEGRRAHVGASADLRVVADEIVQLVEVLDGMNRFRFRDDAEKLAVWESVSSVFATPRPAAAGPSIPETPAQDGQIKPAA